ncbi:thioesterase domain-containing protein [Pigmentibacter sp. JX0631]|uniref:thioesterase II family protein n=1 Tax=Pigmentibacter sp. JX0631 TaxID=2976982 RepID=UPI002468533D|nr:thioesterase domain-containing protein [Pigmentibacter sp. JX0631]WGL60227.1 thioesterase domain-containing protein [Pigmentibacter sp. JX0631]
MINANKNIFIINKIDNPEVKLIVNHHAGGNAAFYFKFTDYFPKNWEIYLIDLPLRSYHNQVKQLKERDDLYHFFSNTFNEFETGNIAIFGHSLGGHISLELAYYLEEIKNIKIKWLGISSKNPPGQSKNTIPLYTYSDEELINWLRKVNGTPSELLENKEILNLFLPSLRHDLYLYHNLNSSFKLKYKLEIPLSIFYGNKDSGIEKEKITNWKNFTKNTCNIINFEGNHFYFNDNLDFFSNTLISEIKRNLIN